MRFAVAIVLFFLIASSASAAGFTAAEIAALPKPDPIEPGPRFFTGPKKPQAVKRTQQQRYILALKAQHRRARRQQLDSRSGTSDVEFAEQATRAFAVGARWHTP